MLVLLFFLNFAISWANAWGCGATWDSTRAKGGLAHLMNWMGAVMSAGGFTWCYLLLVGFVGTMIPAQWFAEEQVAGSLLDPATVQAFWDLGYIVIIFPIIGSGLAITVASWRQFARSGSMLDGAVAGWNTLATVHNVYQATQAIPGATARLGAFFGSGGRSSSDNSKGAIVVLLVAVAVFGGVLTTYGIVQAKRREVIQASAAL